MPIPPHSIPFGAAGDADRDLQLPGAGRTPVLEFLQIISKNLDLPFPRSSAFSNGGVNGGGDAVGSRSDHGGDAIENIPTTTALTATSIWLDSRDLANRGRSWRVVPNTLDGVKPRPLQMSAATQLGVIPCLGQ